MGKPFVQGVCLSTVRFADPPGQALVPSFQYGDSPIGAAAVHNDMLKLRVMLVMHGVERLLQVRGLI